MPNSLSIIIPAYNEATRIGVTLDSILLFSKKCTYKIDITVVLNNTTDTTKDVVEAFQEKVPLRIIDLRVYPSVSGTKGLAVKTGVLAATGEYLLYMDADNATDISQVEHFWPYFNQGAEVVFGSRALKGMHVHRVWYRKLIGKLSNIVSQTLLLPGIYDTQCGFKCFTNKAAKDIFSRVETKGWGFDLEVLALARKLGYTLKEVPVAWHEIKETSVKGGAFLATFRELLDIRRRIGNID